MKLNLDKVEEAARSHPGLWQDLLAQGKLSGDGRHLEMDRPAFDAVMEKYFRDGIGSAIHEVLAPAVKVADTLLGTDLANCGGCAERELKWNS